MSTELYPGIAFSPQATLTNNLGAADTIIRVSDVSAFPPAPNLATIGTDEEGEPILYTAKTADALSGCQRGIEGEARTWAAGELIGRNFTAKDHADLIAAVSETRDAAVTAKDAADAAGNAARTAQGAAEDAKTAAQAEEAQAKTATDTADTASQAARQAQKDAQDAKRAAEDAAQAAQAAGGLYPQIIVSVAAGAVVTCTDGVRNLEKTADNAPVVFDVPDYGEWTVSALRDDLPSDTVTVIVDTAKQYPIALTFFVSTITVTVEAGSTVICEGGGRTQTKTSDGSVVFTVTSAATYIITATTGDETTGGTVEITASEQEETITLEYFRSTITVNIAAGAYVACTNGTTTLDGISNGSVVFEVYSAAAWQITASMNGRTTTGIVTITASGQTKTISLAYVRIYGVSWDGSSTTKLSGTDDAGLFADPAPAVGTGAGFSPFDDCYPWNGMTKVTDGNNVLVKIPKYWVKVQHNPFQVQIADKPTLGYQVSPAHRDRGDGYSERDAVYIGRYECGSSYQSRSGQTPRNLPTRTVRQP